MKKLIFLIILGLMSLTNAAAQNDSNYERELIEQRIKPLGQVTVQDQAQPTHNTVKIATAPPTPLSGVDIYKRYCIVCHAAGLAGAPKSHDAADWNPRLKKGIDGLVKSATSGLNAMPAKGTCMECTDQELKAAIQYMSTQSS